MSLNKFTDENIGYDLKLNIGCDNLKCNVAVVDTLNSTTVNTDNLNITNSTWIEYEPQDAPRDIPPDIGRLAIYKTNNINGSPITSSNSITIDPEDGNNNGEILNIRSNTLSSTGRINANVFYPQMIVSNIAAGTTQYISAQFDIRQEMMVYSGDETTTQANCDSILILPEYRNQVDRTWCFKLTARGCKLNLITGAPVFNDFYPLNTPNSPLDYTITPPPNGLAIVHCYWIPNEEIFFCIQVA